MTGASFQDRAGHEPSPDGLGHPVTIPRAFAVTGGGVNRRTATKDNPLSAGWTLYDPAVLAERLGLPIEQVNAALIETGFEKAVRVRMELVRWKERLRLEDRALSDELGKLRKQEREIKVRQRQVHEALNGARNILRLPRDGGAA